MTKSSLWIALACLCLVPGAGQAHRISFVGEIYCPDLNDDGEVNFDDVALLVVRFGQDCPEADGCAADFNHNHYVGEGDLMIVLGNWGSCPSDGDANRDGVVNDDDRIAITNDLGVDCAGDLDNNGSVAGLDVAIAEEAWSGGSDNHPGTAEVSGNDTLSPLDLLRVIEAMGRDCRSDINHDGAVDNQDLVDLCNVAGVCAAPAG